MPHTFHEGPELVIKTDKNGLYYWMIKEGTSALAMSPVNRHRPLRADVLADAIRVVNCALPEECAEEHGRWIDTAYDCGVRAGERHVFATVKRWAIGLLIVITTGIALLATVLLLTGCGSLGNRRLATAPLSVSPDAGGAQTATAAPIIQSVGRTRQHTEDIEAAVARYEVPALVEEVKPHADGIRGEQDAIAREAVTLADFANEQAHDAYSARSGPRRAWAWMTNIGMMLGGVGILLGIGLAIWAGRPKVGALTVASGLATLVTSYLLAAFIQWIIWGGFALLVLGIGYALWTARKNLFADPPGKVTIDAPPAPPEPPAESDLYT